MSDKKMISNIALSKDCVVELRYIANQKEIRVQEVAAQILEKAMRKKIEKKDKSGDGLDEII